MDKIKAAEERYPLTDNLAVTKRSAFVMGWDAAISTQSPKWVKAKDRLPGDEVESLKEMPLRDAITKVPYHKVDILGFDNKTMYYRGINDEIHVKIKNIEWRESSTQPLQEKIDGLREALERVLDYENKWSIHEIAKQALETYK